MRGTDGALTALIVLGAVEDLARGLAAGCVTDAVLTLVRALVFTCGTVKDTVAGCVAVLVSGLVIAAVRVSCATLGIANILNPTAASVRGAVLTFGNASPLTRRCNRASSPFVSVDGAGSLNVVGFGFAVFGAICNCGA
jgi:hypothetical protein